MENNPMLLLGQLHTKVNYLEVETAKQTGLLEKVSADLTDLKIQRASESGQRKGIINMGRVVEFTITIIAGAVAAYTTVKAMVLHAP